MDKMKGLAKGGWHPAGDKPIHRNTWKSDLKGMATGRNKDPYEEQRNHQSAPLSSLKDPDSFGPPPKHSAYYGENAVARTDTGLSITSSSAAGGPTGGWGASAVESGYAQRKREQEEAERKRLEQQAQEESTTRGPYQMNTTGLTTNNLPKPPIRRGAPTESPTLPPRQNARPQPAIPPRHASGAPPPILPPRQNENPDEYTPEAPPPYQEALKQPAAGGLAQVRDPSQLNQAAMQRLGQAGISVPAFGITGNVTSSEPSTQGSQTAQVSELQQRFARMNTAGSSPPVRNFAMNAPGSNGISAAGTAQKKPPPPPPKKLSLSASTQTQQTGGNSNQNDAPAPAPPPVPTGSKPRPG